VRQGPRTCAKPCSRLENTCRGSARAIEDGHLPAQLCSRSISLHMEFDVHVGKGRAPPLGCKHGTLPDVRMCLHTCTQLLDHALTHHRRPPALFPAHHCCFSCLSHAMRGVLCCEGRLRGGADRPALVQGVSCKHALEHLALHPSRACPRYQHTTTNKPGTKSHTRGMGRDTARYLQAGDTAPECTAGQAATTGGGVPANWL